jgi:hypothetical protein
MNMQENKNQLTHFKKFLEFYEKQEKIYSNQQIYIYKKYETGLYTLKRYNILKACKNL